MTGMQDGLQDPADAGHKKRQNRDVARLVAAVVIVGLLVAFVVDNSNTVQVGFVFFHRSVPLIWVLLVTALLGACIDRLLIWRRARGRRQAAKDADR
jgi:uncharacterized integral membrane protein